MDNRIIENAVWDNAIVEDSSNTPDSNDIVTPSQMTFCHNCNRVIPADSSFCPWCRQELYVTCPQCNHKYSSQYPICNQCGTDREDFLRNKAERQRKKKEKEEKIRREAEEAAEKRTLQLRLKEKEKQRIKREERRKEREENNKIKKSAEYKETYECMMLLKNWLKRRRRWKILEAIGIFVIPFCGIPLASYYSPTLDWIGLLMIIVPFIIFFIILNCSTKSSRQKAAKEKQQISETYLRKLVSYGEITNPSKRMITHLVSKNKIMWENLEEEIIEAYKVTINK